MDQEIADFAQIRDIIIAAVTEQIKDADFFEYYDITITIVGKINKNGLKIAFKVKNKPNQLNPELVEFKDKVSPKIKDVWTRITTSNTFLEIKELEFSVGVEVPWLTQNSVLINIKHK
jgi:hypothetical protein